MPTVRNVDSEYHESRTKHGVMQVDQYPESRANSESDIDALARETDAPIEIVREMYSSERAKLERSARIKTYIPLLILKHVKALLRAQSLTS
jgi:hypothetical protein